MRPDENPEDAAARLPLSPEREAKLMILADRLGVPSVDIPLLNQALTHSSFLNENNLTAVSGNERLEFLGDSVLGLAVTEHLYRTYPHDPEGNLSKVKSVVVSARILGRAAMDLDLGEHLSLGRGEDLSGGRSRESILSACYEAVVGAIYLSRGFDVARGLVLATLTDEVEMAATGESTLDYKSTLQEKTQQARGAIPRYRVVRIAGPDHDRRFDIEVRVGNELLGQGAGKSKKAAEQKAAENALEQIGDAWDEVDGTSPDDQTDNSGGDVS